VGKSVEIAVLGIVLLVLWPDGAVLVASGGADIDRWIDQELLIIRAASFLFAFRSVIWG